MLVRQVPVVLVALVDSVEAVVVANIIRREALVVVPQEILVVPEIQVILLGPVELIQVVVEVRQLKVEEFREILVLVVLV